MGVLYVITHGPEWIGIWNTAMENSVNCHLSPCISFADFLVVRCKLNTHDKYSIIPSNKNRDGTQQAVKHRKGEGGVKGGRERGVGVRGCERLVP